MKRNLPKARQRRCPEMSPGEASTHRDLLGELPPGIYSAGGAREGRHPDSWLCAASGRH